MKRIKLLLTVAVLLTLLKQTWLNINEVSCFSLMTPLLPFNSSLDSKS
ncbi:hypothetical protein BTN50_0994 [Candidatus Enterovibrio altilux]|uniref:Uncharacterized protein n=1 Tax=Candidatus Enterovibrio altilux TaxID=1927128 RepID=A0A291B905_9GAMM|nr:hypothetical protein BTN50_0994 [Candidatus Enterovibrio luxaltus]